MKNWVERERRAVEKAQKEKQNTSKYPLIYGNYYCKICKKINCGKTHLVDCEPKTEEK